MQKMKDLAGPLQGCFHSAMATLAQIATEAGVSEATVSRVLNSKPGVARAPGSRSSPRSTCSATSAPPPAPAQRRPGRADGARAGEPHLPGLRPGHRGRARATTVHAGPVHAVARRPDRGRVRRDRCSTAASPASSSSRQARRHPCRPRALPPLRERGLPVVLINGYVDEVDAPFVSPDDRVAMDLAVAHLAHLGHRRIGLAIGPAASCRPAQARGLRGRPRTPPRHGRRRRRRLVAETLFSVEGGGRGRAPAARAGRHGHRLRLGHDGARCDPRGTGRGPDVPGEVSVVGFDDSPLVASSTRR